MKREDEADRTVLLQEVCVDEDARLTELFLLAARGDERASQEFWGSARRQAQVKRDCELICWRYPLPGGDLIRDSEDLAQRTCMRMFEKGEQFKGLSQVRTWSMCIARRLHFKEFAKRQMERQRLRDHPCEASPQLSDEVPGVRLAVIEVLEGLSVFKRTLYEMYVHCCDVWEVAQMLHGSEWLSMSEQAQRNERNRIARILKEIQMILVGVAELKWLTAFGQQDKGTDDAPTN
jgi:DNA-directed RNA polymerase specialized sigma24 family protein